MKKSKNHWNIQIPVYINLCMHFMINSLKKKKKNLWNIQMDIILCMHLTINLIEIMENIKFWCLQFLMQTIKLKHHEIGNVLFSAMHRSSFIKMALVFCLTLHYWPAVHNRMRLQSLNDIVCAWKNKLKQKIRETGTLWKLGQDFYDLSQIGWFFKLAV